MDSLKKRYFIKLAKSCSDALINILLLLFVPRVLGPAAYGSFNYIRDLFRNIISLSDLNLGSAHINYAARKEKSNLASSVYFSFTLLVGAAVLLFVLFINLTGFNRYIFPEQSPSFLIAGAFLAYMMYLFTATMGLSDSKGITYGFELRSIAISIVLFGVLVALYLSGMLTLKTFFAQRIILYALLLFFGSRYLCKKIDFRPRVANLNDQKSRVVIRDFISFSYPLIIMSVIGIVMGLFDRWFLQIIYGSVSQGFFSLAFSVSSIAGLFLAPMTPLLMQTVAKADENDDLGGVRDAFEKVKILYMIGAFFSIFFMFHTSEIISLIGGEDYRAARLTVLVMFLYPVHVVYGQFCGGVLLALRKTGLYRNITLVSSFLGLILTYILLAPKSFIVPGLELNSMGLALKLVLIQFFSVTLQLFFVCRIVGVNISHYLFSQLIIPLPMLLVGTCEWLIREQFSLTFQGALWTGLNLVMSITTWGVVVGISVWNFPTLVGLSKADLRNTFYQLISVFHSKG
jgi:O-antigen/teichoic acid export membrane protein